MKKRLSHFICCLLTSCIMLSETCTQAATYQSEAQNISAQAETSTTVSTFDDFFKALGKYKHIIVAKSFQTAASSDKNGQTIPIDIPADTTIEGKDGSTVGIVCRGPIQLKGDNVTFKNLQLHFESSDAMGSVPQREIFLAGHSLTLDKVDTHLEGAGDTLGGFGSSEKELLPTVYAGGFYTNTDIGTNASFTVINATSKTIIKDIIMGHDDNKNKYTAYTGKASLILNEYTQLRGTISTEASSSASILLTGTTKQDFAASSIIGNDNTTLTIDGCNTTTKMPVNGIGNIHVTNSGTFAPSDTSNLNNISVDNGGFLDLTAMPDATINGNFTGGNSAQKANIIVSRGGHININKTASGVSQLYITSSSQSCADTPFENFNYITAKGDSSNAEFNFTDKLLKAGYSLVQNNNTWTCKYDAASAKDDIASIDVTDYPSDILIDKLPTDSNDIEENSPSMNITWKKSTGTPWDKAIAAQHGFWEYMAVVRTDYWSKDNSNVNSNTKYIPQFHLDYTDENSGKYYLLRNGNINIENGKYTFIFFSESIDDKELNTISDVKALKNIIKATIEINITNGTATTEPTTEPTTKPTAEPTTKPTAEPTTEPTAEPTTKPTSEPTMKPTSEPTTKPTTAPTTVPSTVPSTSPTVPVQTNKPSGGSGSGSSSGGSTPTTSKPTTAPYASPDVKPTSFPTNEPTATVKPADTAVPTIVPTATVQPNTQKPTTAPTKPDTTPTTQPTEPTITPTTQPTEPTTVPTNKPTATPSHKHKIIQVLKKATCKKSGSITYICQTCKKVIKKTSISALKKTSINKINAGKKSLTINFKKQSKNTSGYQISYSVKKTFADDKKKTVASFKSSSATVSELKSNKKYYIRIRTYKTVKVNGKNVKMYGAWSKTQTAATK